jgi:Astacin (Peptidase family M12A)
MRFRLVSVLAVVAAAVAATPQRAAAYSLSGDPWPEPSIRYAIETPAYAGAVEAAARTWNRTGINVRFVKSDADEADVVIRYGNRACEGSAPIGYQRHAVSEVRLGRGCGGQLARLVAIHELGHVLGLDHEATRCARMNAVVDRSGTPGRCKPRSLAQWLAHPLLADDLRGARALYGTRRT